MNCDGQSVERLCLTTSNEMRVVNETAAELVNDQTSVKYRQTLRTSHLLCPFLKPMTVP